MATLPWRVEIRASPMPRTCRYLDELKTRRIHGGGLLRVWPHALGLHPLTDESDPDPGQFTFSSNGMQHGRTKDAERAKREFVRAGR